MFFQGQLLFALQTCTELTLLLFTYNKVSVISSTLISSFFRVGCSEEEVDRTLKILMQL